MFPRIFFCLFTITLASAVTFAQDPEREAKAADAKKNARPAVAETIVRERSPALPVEVPVRYEYVFEQPNFLVSRMSIKHDENGRGTIEFDKSGYGGTVSDPIMIAPSVVEKITSAYRELNFLESTDVYQDERDFSHLGNSTLKVESAGRTRAVTVNWTQNKQVREVLDQYRKIGNQHVWIFDITLARENQPLETPKLVNNLQGLIGRNEIADPAGMLGLLDGLANDERIPLMARNQAVRIAAGIRKKQK